MKELKNPPIAVAIFQVRYNSEKVSLKDFLAYDNILKNTFPIRRENIHVGIDLGNTSIPLGVSQLSATSNAAIDAYVYQTVDQKTKLELSKGVITYVDEHHYLGWESFKEAALKFLNFFSKALDGSLISRVSIRFINKFSLTDFDHPEEFFTTLISSSSAQGLSYPLRKYGFRLIMDVPDSDIYSIVNQNVENSGDKLYTYTFDIDVLDRQTVSFDINTISDNVEVLRQIKNKIFFEGITQKTIDLCD